jgi:hypothetical protein
MQPEAESRACEIFHTTPQSDWAAPQPPPPGGGSQQVEAALAALGREIGVAKLALVATREGVARLVVDFGFERVMAAIPVLAQHLLGLSETKNVVCKYIAGYLRRQDSDEKAAADRWPLVAKRDAHFEAATESWSTDDPRWMSCFTLKHLLGLDGKPFTRGSKKFFSLYHLAGRKKNRDAVWPDDHRPFAELMLEGGPPEWWEWPEFQSHREEWKRMSGEAGR